MGNIPKKHLVLSVLLCFVISASVNAATIETLTINAGHIKVDGASDSENVSYKVYKNGDTETDISKICEMGEANVADGKFSISFIMPKTMQGTETDGEYRIDIRDGSKVSQDFLYTGYTYRAAFLNDLNTKTTGSGVFDLFEGSSSDNSRSNIDIMRNLGVDTDYYNTLDAAEKQKIADAFLTEKGAEAVDEGNFSIIYNHAQDIQNINKNKATQAWLSESDLEFEGVKFRDTDEGLKNWILNAINDGTVYSSYSDIEKKYRELNILYLINNAKYTEYDGLMEKYDNVLGITSESYYGDYLKMSAGGKSSVNSKLKDALTASPAKSISELSEKYNTAVSNVKKELNKSGGSSSGGVGSSGGGGSSGGVRSGVKSGIITGTGVIVPEIADPTKERPDFKDLDGVEWAREAIEALADKGIVSGYDKNTFKPLQNIKREEFVKMVISALGYGIDAKDCPFSDVDKNAWYAPFVYEAYARGIINGISEEEFGIGSEIKREDMAVITARIVVRNEDAAAKSLFSDDGDIASYAKEAVYRLYNSGKVSGIGNNLFGPKKIVNRAQAAKIIYDTIVNAK